MNKTQKDRTISAAIITKLVDAGIEIQAIATMLEVTRPTIYNWLGGFFLPPAKLCLKIEAFAKLVVQVRKDWKRIIRNYEESHRAVEVTLFKPGPLRILKSNLGYSVKCDRLTAMTFSGWEKSKRGKNELS